MLNVCQLMIAFWLNWLTVTLALPGFCTLAAPPTTVAPFGPATAAPIQIGVSAAVVRRRLRKRIGPFS